jgi:hypothetical protein
VVSEERPLTWRAAEVPDVANPRHARELERQVKAYRQAADDVLVELMSRRNGRAWIYDLLERCHCFESSFSSDPLAMAFSEGERNTALKFLADINRVCPDHYITMVRERHARELANASRNQQLDEPEPSYGPGHPDYPTDEQLATYAIPDGNGGAFDIE